MISFACRCIYNKQTAVRIFFKESFITGTSNRGSPDSYMGHICIVMRAAQVYSVLCVGCRCACPWAACLTCLINKIFYFLSYNMKCIHIITRKTHTLSLILKQWLKTEPDTHTYVSHVSLSHTEETIVRRLEIYFIDTDNTAYFVRISKFWKNCVCE